MVHNKSVRSLSFCAALGALLVIFFAVARPWYLQWGATDEEARGRLPVDEIVTDAGSQVTRAITINANVDRVWPWLAQSGQDRGGFYSYDMLENIVGCRMPTMDVLRPGSAQWQLGDKLWMYPPEKAGGAGFATLRVYIPGRALGFGTRMVGTPLSAPENGSWSFVLEPVDAGHTRLIMRGRGASGRSLLGGAFDRSIFEPVHFAMERRMMIGLKQLAESGDRHRIQNHIMVALWAITFGIFVTAMVLVWRRVHWGRPLAVFFAAGMIFQILTLLQPAIAPSIALTLLAPAILTWPRRGREKAPVATQELQWIQVV